MLCCQELDGKSSKVRQETSQDLADSSMTDVNEGTMLGRSSSRPELSSKRMSTYDSTQSTRSQQSGDGHYLTPARISALNRKDSSISDTGSAPDSLLDLYGGKTSGADSVDSTDAKHKEKAPMDEDPERSRWIHRDKLARIESQELQAAGIIFPRARTSSRAGRGRSGSKDQFATNGNPRSEQHTNRPRVEDIPTEEGEEEGGMDWDLRSPEEVAADKNNLHGSWRSDKGISRLPLPKNSPVPIPLDYIARDTPVARKQSGGWTAEEDQIAYPKRGRSGSIPLPNGVATAAPAKRTQSEAPLKKATTPAARKLSGTPGSRAPSSQARPKTRSGPNSNKENQRTSNRSVELGPGIGVKRPEGDPPWLATMYKPDPRLPPDQQLLPTVAKRLQQEQWAKEGKFGNMYDTNFRPLNEDQLQERPSSQILNEAVEPPSDKSEDPSNWPLQAQPKSPTLSTGRPETAGGYSTMPKIRDQTQSPHPSAKPVLAAQPQRQSLRLQEPSEEAEKKGCGCCVVM